MKHYTFLFKTNADSSWEISERFIARSEDDAIEQAIRYAENNGYCDFTLA